LQFQLVSSFSLAWGIHFFKSSAGDKYKNRL